MIETIVLVYVQVQAQRAVFTAFLRLEFVAREVGNRGVVEDARFVLRRVRGKGAARGRPKVKGRASVRSNRHDRGTKEDVTKVGYPVDGLPATVTTETLQPLLQLYLGRLLLSVGFSALITIPDRS